MIDAENTRWSDLETKKQEYLKDAEKRMNIMANPF